jgi:hypothetical protein
MIGNKRILAAMRGEQPGYEPFASNFSHCFCFHKSRGTLQPELHDATHLFDALRTLGVDILARWDTSYATRADLKTHPFPDGKDPHRVNGLAERARFLREQTPYAVLGEVSGHILERAQMVRGFDTFLEDLAA